MAEPTAALVSIVIPAFNSGMTLGLTLPSILRQDRSLIADITVVDSSDDGGMESIIEAYAPLGLRFINSGLRVMPARQRNIGARASKGKLLLFLDADVILEDDYVRKIVYRFSNGFRAGFGAVELPDFQAWRALPLAQYYIQLSEYIPRGEARGKPFFLGCSAFCDRELFEAVGGYPEIRASEDVLFGKAVSRIETIWFVPEARVKHIFREKWSGFLANQRLLGKYTAVCRKDESESWIYRGFAPVALLPLFFAFKLFRILPRILSSGIWHLFKFALVSSLFTLGIVSWCLGFIDGLQEPKLTTILGAAREKYPVKVP